MSNGNRFNRPELSYSRWTNEEDEVLVRILIRYARAGETQIEAYKQASYRLDRTESACQFRWSSVLNKIDSNRRRYNMARAEGKKKIVRVIDTDEMEKGYRQMAELHEAPKKFIAQASTETLDERYLTPKQEPKASEKDIINEVATNPIYSSVLDVMVKAQRRQVAYGLDKYVESLNVDSWSTLETLDHIISETVDQLHYLSMLKLKIINNLQQEEE